MCGISGIFYKDRKEPVSSDLLEVMTRAMSHRGPDDEGYFLEGNIGLGHRRLSIIDLTGGHQPIFNEDKTVAVILNGEIYNYKNLTAELENKGHRFYTKTDTEAIVHAYEEYGPACVQKLRGMYAFAIWDKKKNQLMLARDRIGKKPLYYWQNDHALIFASEIKSILRSGLVRKEADIPLIDFYLSLGYVPGDRTLFKGINKVEPAHYMVVRENGQTEICRYWDIDKIKTVDYSLPEALGQFEKKLLESIEIRLMSEVPLGVFLSGGLDSSSIVALMDKLGVRPIKTFSVGYKDDREANELDYAQIIASLFKTEHHRFYLTPEDMFESIDTLLTHTEEPIIESAGIALYKLAALAKPLATVLLSGEGGDELFAGYPIYPKMRTMETLSHIVRWLPKGLFRPAHGFSGGNEKQEKYLEWITQPFENRFRSLSYDLVDATKNRMYTPEFSRVADGLLEDFFLNLHQRCAGNSLLGRMLYIDTKTWLPDDLLVKADKMTMAAAVELRAPFLDQELLEFATALPDSFKLYGRIGKFILKKYMKNKIPDKIINREKKGFPVPLTSWFKSNLHERAKDLLLNVKSLSRGYFQKMYLEGLFERIKRGEDLGRRIFSLVVLELWHQKYID